MEVTKETPNYKIILRNLKTEDYEDLAKARKEAYKGKGYNWKREQFEKLLKIFPEGQIGIEVNGKIVGVALSIIVKYGKFGDNHTYEQITGKFRFTTHDPEGEVLYGIDMFVLPEFQGLRIGRRLYDARKELCENLNLKSIISSGRIPGYKEFTEDLKPRDYIEKVNLKELYDPILSFQFSNGFHVKKIQSDYMPTDKESKSFTTLLEWHNIYYEENELLIGGRHSVVRIGVVQWQMRSVTSVDEIIDQIEFFVETLGNYNADFILFPELFNAPLMAKYNELSESDAIRALASYTELLKNKLIEFAISYNINIISGSMPLIEDGKLYNVSYLCKRDGTFESQHKIHITPVETRFWGIVGGNKLQVFDTDSGRIGILICYDSEFPELSRILADQGMEILFVPFLTDTQTGFNRVRRCAQARAVENECYVAIAGCVGNLPKVKNMDIQYAQSAVFSPSDFAFPETGIIAEATPNTEMTLIADVDLDLLKELKTKGSVRNLSDRRKDLYNLGWNTSI